MDSEDKYGKSDLPSLAPTPGSLMKGGLIRAQSEGSSVTTQEPLHSQFRKPRNFNSGRYDDRDNRGRRDRSNREPNRDHQTRGNLRWERDSRDKDSRFRNNRPYNGRREVNQPSRNRYSTFDRRNDYNKNDWGDKGNRGEKVVPEKSPNSVSPSKGDWFSSRNKETSRDGPKLERSVSDGVRNLSVNVGYERTIERTPFERNTGNDSNRGYYNKNDHHVKNDRFNEEQRPYFPKNRYSEYDSSSKVKSELSMNDRGFTDKYDREMKRHALNHNERYSSKEPEFIQIYENSSSNTSYSKSRMLELAKNHPRPRSLPYIDGVTTNHEICPVNLAPLSTEEEKARAGQTPWYYGPRNFNSVRGRNRGMRNSRVGRGRGSGGRWDDRANFSSQKQQKFYGGKPWFEPSPRNRVDNDETLQWESRKMPDRSGADNWRRQWNDDDNDNGIENDDDEYEEDVENNSRKMEDKHDKNTDNEKDSRPKPSRDALSFLAQQVASHLQDENSKSQSKIQESNQMGNHIQGSNSNILDNSIQNHAMNWDKNNENVINHNQSQPQQSQLQQLPHEQEQQKQGGGLSILHIVPNEGPRKWFYRDPQGIIQGPFHDEEMRLWYNEGYFNESLQVTCEPRMGFIPLGKLFEAGHRGFLESNSEMESSLQSGKSTMLQTGQSPKPQMMGQYGVPVPSPHHPLNNEQQQQNLLGHPMFPPQHPSHMAQFHPQSPMHHPPFPGRGGSPFRGPMPQPQNWVNNSSGSNDHIGIDQNIQNKPLMGGSIPNQMSNVNLYQMYPNANVPQNSNYQSPMKRPNIPSQPGPPQFMFKQHEEQYEESNQQDELNDLGNHQNFANISESPNKNVDTSEDKSKSHFELVRDEKEKTQHPMETVDQEINVNEVEKENEDNGDFNAWKKVENIKKAPKASNKADKNKLNMYSESSPSQNASNAWKNSQTIDNTINDDEDFASETIQKNEKLNQWKKEFEERSRLANSNAQNVWGNSIPEEPKPTIEEPSTEAIIKSEDSSNNAKHKSFLEIQREQEILDAKERERLKEVEKQKMEQMGRSTASANKGNVWGSVKPPVINDLRKILETEERQLREKQEKNQNVAAPVVQKQVQSASPWGSVWNSGVSAAQIVASSGKRINPKPEPVVQKVTPKKNVEDSKVNEEEDSFWGESYDIQPAESPPKNLHPNPQYKSSPNEKQNKSSSSSNAFGGPALPSELEKWSAGQLQNITGSSDTTLAQFLMTLNTEEEIRSYIIECLGADQKVKKFADGFISQMAFHQEKVVVKKGGAKLRAKNDFEKSSEQDQRNSKKSRRRKKKGGK